MSDDSCPPADAPIVDPFTGEVIKHPTSDEIARYCTEPYWTGCFQADHRSIDENGVTSEQLSLIEFRTLVGGAVPMRVMFAMDRERAANLGRYLIWMAEPDGTPPPAVGVLIMSDDDTGEDL